jgi:hypothetical protein
MFQVHKVTHVPVHSLPPRTHQQRKHPAFLVVLNAPYWLLAKRILLVSVGERPHTALQSPHANQAAAHTPLSKRKVPRREPHQTDKLSPIHRRIASAHVRVCQCTLFSAVVRKSNASAKALRVGLIRRCLPSTTQPLSFGIQLFDPCSRRYC